MKKSRGRNVSPAADLKPRHRARDYRPVLGLVAIAVFLLCFRPIIAFKQYTHLDDLSYLKQAANFLGLDYPMAPNTSYPPGAALAWMPAGLAASAYSLVAHVPEATALPIFVGLLSYAYWCASLFLLAAMIRMTAGPGVTVRQTVIGSLVALLGVPLLYYATHRTTLVHPPEFFFALATAFFVLGRKPVLAFGSALLVFSLRLNDVPILLFALAPAIEAHWASIRAKRVFLAAGVLVLSAAVAYVVWLGFSAGYNRLNFSRLFTNFSLMRIPIVLFSGDWGLLWTAPAWLLCLLASALRFQGMSLAAKFAGVWMLCELVLCVLWAGNGSDFGYRYLIGRPRSRRIVIDCLNGTTGGSSSRFILIIALLPH